MDEVERHDARKTIVSHYTPEFGNLVSSYENSVAWHQWAYDDFDFKVRNTGWLFDHRKFVVGNFWGFGDTCHWWMWKLLVDQLSCGFKFLEIGVYRGAVLSLIARLAAHQYKEGYTYGVSPLKPTTDDYETYAESPKGYQEDISFACRLWGNNNQPQLLAGMSYEPNIVADAKMYGPYDIVYIDGGHTYECVAMDIFNYVPLVKRGGFLVMDDASWFLKFRPEIWRGYESVGTAIRDYLDTRLGPEHLFAIGHNRIWSL